MSIRSRLFLVFIAVGDLISAAGAAGQGGHGPAFGMATPTLPRGAWNVDVTMMTVESGARGAAIRGTIRYGWSEDLQVNLSAPLALDRIPQPPSTRVGTMMAGMDDAEASLLWRIHKQYPGVGARLETTLVFAGLVPGRARRRGLETAPGFLVGAVTGYASRTVYAWVGGGYQHYLEASGDRLGDLTFLSLVTAWRPPVFQGDFPKPDWRIFVESLIEFAGTDQAGGAEVSASDGKKVFVGPSLLGLYRAFGFGAGGLIPVYQRFDNPFEEGVRYTLNLSYWF